MSFNQKGRSLQIFENPEFGQVRVIEVESKPYFVAIDVAKMLGYTNTSKAINDHCRGVTKRYIPTISGEQEVNLIPEGDIYRLIIRSKLPSAERFEQWVFDEVLPTIRKHGMYMTSEMARMAIDDVELFLSRALLIAKDKIDVLQSQVNEAKPKVLFADAVSSSKTSISIGDLAKILKQNGIETGRHRLFEWLRENGYLMKTGYDRNMPTQKAMEMNLFEIKESTFQASSTIKITKTTKVTGKGQVYFVNLFKKQSA